MSWLRALCIALQLLTRLPTPNCGYDEKSSGRSLLFYPVIGCVLGALIAAAGWLMSAYVPVLPLAALLLAVWVMLTGALHLDGLADSADGWLGGHGDREKTLAIMRDPRSGTAAIVAVAVVLLLKFATLTVIVERHDWLSLASIPLLARTMAMLLFLTTRCARSTGMAAELVVHLPRGSAWLMVVLGLAVSTSMSSHLLVLSVTFVTFFMLRRLMIVNINGMTGDTTGALIEIIETVTLLALIVGA